MYGVGGRGCASGHMCEKIPHHLLQIVLLHKKRKFQILMQVLHIETSRLPHGWAESGNLQFEISTHTHTHTACQNPTKVPKKYSPPRRCSIDKMLSSILLVGAILLVGGMNCKVGGGSRVSRVKTCTQWRASQNRAISQCKQTYIVDKLQPKLTKDSRPAQK